MLENINIGFDILLATFLVNSDRPKFDPDSITAEYTGYSLGVPYEQKLAHLCALNFISYQILGDELTKMKLDSLLSEIEIPFQKVLAQMEKTGIKIDVGKLHDLSNKFQRELKVIEAKIYELAGIPFNINSPKQLSEVLFNKLKLRPVKKTKTGYSTDEETLRKLAEDHPLPRLILDYREVFKMKSTYLDSFLELLDPATLRIYPTFNQVGAATGRISCLNPNFQTLPIKSTVGRDIRDLVVAEEGFKILAADYSQIELRILAHFSEDKKLIEIFKNDQDVHSITASYIFNKPVSEVTELERRKAKTVNFGIIYGISPYGLSKELNIDVVEAEKLISMFFATYPGVMEWIQKTLQVAKEREYVRTLLGRLRHVPGLSSSDSFIYEQAKRIAINTPIQGTAADLMKIAMIKVYDELKRRNLKSRMILQIHDEILLEIKNEEEEEVITLIRNVMENVIPLKVPLKVSIGTGESWLQASNK
jgi:DNA polymerase-1